MESNRARIDPRHPSVIGFDAPSSSAAPSADMVLSVLLDTEPAREWAEVFHREAERLRMDRGLLELRLVGDHVTAVGTMREPRRLAQEIQALIHRVSRLCLHLRVTSLATTPLAGGGEQVIHQPDPALQSDIDAVARVPGLAALLESTSRATGMRFAAVARVTDQQWIACAVYDMLEFGLRPGQELVLETTLCNEIRQHHALIAFNSARDEPAWRDHPTPARYGFESYISVPIFRGDGSFFGTLCAIDRDPARLDAETIATVQLYAEMIGLHLERDAQARAQVSSPA